MENFEQFMTTVLTEAMKKSQTGQVKPATNIMYQELAEHLWKQFDAFCEVGFNEEMAFDLLLTILSKGVK